MGYAVRPMQTEDIPQVSAIDREAFPTQWPPTSFTRELGSKMIHYLVAFEEGSPGHRTEVSEQKAEGNLPRLVSWIRRLFDKERSAHQGMVTHTDQNIVGYASMWLMMAEAHLTSIAVRETHHRRGIGELLLISIINLAAKLNARVITLEVRASNFGAQALYEKYGFSKVGVRRGYYSDDGEDGVIMTTGRITSDSYQARFAELKQEYVQRWGVVRGI